MANGKNMNIWCMVKLVLLLIVTVMTVLIYMEVRKNKDKKEGYGASGGGYRKHFA